MHTQVHACIVCMYIMNSGYMPIRGQKKNQIAERKVLAKGKSLSQEPGGLQIPNPSSHPLPTPSTANPRLCTGLAQATGFLTSYMPQDTLLYLVCLRSRQETVWAYPTTYHSKGQPHGPGVVDDIPPHLRFQKGTLSQIPVLLSRDLCHAR